MTAKNRHNGRKRHAKGIAVGNRFRVDAYFKTQEQITQIDHYAEKHNESRSEYVTKATFQRIDRDEKADRLLAEQEAK